MSYIGNPITTQAFVTDQFNGSGSQVTYTMSVAPANTASVLVSVSGVLQDPSTYSVSGTTLTFSAAPPAGTGNISCRYLGIPATGITNTAYRTVTEFTATAGQTGFTVPSYTIGFLNVYRNGILLGSADYTANNGVTITLSAGCNAGDTLTTESFQVSSVLNAIPNGIKSISNTNLPVGSVLQVVQGSTTTSTSTTSTNFTATSLSASITPYFSTSKILVITSSMHQIINTPGAAGLGLAIYRNGSSIYSDPFPYASMYMGQLAANPRTRLTLNYLDSPASTSSTNYTLYFNAFNGQTSSMNIDGQTSFITLMEIA